ncbi:MAG: M48 family metallopeptidase [Phycisphaeraceae bacterium]
MKNSPKEDRPIALPTGTIPPIQTAASLESAVMLSAFVIAVMVGLYVLITLAWGWLTVRLLMSLPDRFIGSYIFDTFWVCLSASVVLVLIFLIKPLLPLRRKHAPPIELTDSDQPELFAYIRALAKCIDAPEPDRVLVDVHPNASASFAGGMSPTSGPLTLTLGLPLIGGMTVRQLAGVIAHELGHFSQGSMVKQNIVIGFVSGWLTEVALGEDRFDRLINQLADGAPPIIRHLFKLIRFVIVAIRRVFYVVMIVGHLVTRMVARQLEFDADQFMAHTTGSEHFAETMRETIVLGHAGMQAIEDAQQFYRDRRLPNDLPAMVVTRARRMDDKQRKKLLRGEDQGHAEAFSTHPLTGKRIDAARALNSKGLIHDDRPARGLFRNFEKLCQDASEALYKEVIGKDYDAKHLTDSSRLIAELEATDKARRAAGRFCQSELLLMLPVFPSYRGLRMPDSPQEALGQVRDLRDRARDMRAKAFPLMRKYQEAQDKLVQSRQAHVATQAGFEIRD